MESLCLWRPDAFGELFAIGNPCCLEVPCLAHQLGFFMKRVRHNGKFVGKYWDLELWNQKKAKHRVWSRFPFFWKLWISCLVFQTFTQPSTRKRWDGFKPSGSCSPTTRKVSWLFQPNRWKRASGIPHQQFGSTVVTWLLISGQKGLVWPNSWENIFFFWGVLRGRFWRSKCLSRLPCYQPLSKKGWCYIWEILWESHGFSWILCHAQVP